MTTDNDLEFDELLAMALAQAADVGEEPRGEVKVRLMARLGEPSLPPAPPGFAFRYEDRDEWLPHPLPGIKMRILAMNRKAGYATVVFDVAPGTRFPAHHHGAAEECYVISGSLYTCGRRLGPGDFVHADEGTDHGELYTDEGVRVLLVVEPEVYFPEPR